MSKNEGGLQASAENGDDSPRQRLYLFCRRWVVRLLRIEALVLLLLAIYLVVAALGRTVSSFSGLLGEILFAILGAIGLYIASIGYRRGHSFGRAPSVLANLIALGVSYFMYSGHAIRSAIPLSIIAALTLFAAILGYQEPSE